MSAKHRVICIIGYRKSKVKYMSVQGNAKTWPACPIETTLTLNGDKWKVLILRDLLTGTKRFGELKKSIGSVSQKVEYSLTKLGWSLQPILDAIKDWGEDYKSSLEKKYENHKKI